MISATLAGKKFGLLTVTGKAESDKWGHSRWNCICVCGGIKMVTSGDLKYGGVKSCGCLNYQMGEQNKNWKGGKIEVLCANPNCNKMKSIYLSYKRNYKTFYCSNECRYAHRPDTIRGENNPRYKKKIKINCGFCGKGLEVFPSNAALYKNHFCKGTDCQSKWNSENRKGELNANYHGGTPEMRIIRRRISASMRKAIRQEKAGRRWESLVEYSMTDLINRLKVTIPQGYSWEKDFIDGKGVLHIDHKKPMSSFSFEKAEDEEFRRCFALNNLQLLPAIENMKKSAKYEQQIAV